MYHDPMDRLERILKPVAIAAIVLTLLFIGWQWSRAEEPLKEPTSANILSVVDMAPFDAVTTVRMYAVRVENDAKDADVTPLFPVGRPVVGQCFGLKAVDAKGAIGLVYVPQPCWIREIPEECQWTGSCIVVREGKMRVCYAGWCLTREETP